MRLTHEVYGVAGEKSTGLLWDFRIVVVAATAAAAATAASRGDGDGERAGTRCGNKGQKISKYDCVDARNR